VKTPTYEGKHGTSRGMYTACMTYNLIFGAVFLFGEGQSHKGGELDEGGVAGAGRDRSSTDPKNNVA
jgi:hypothetical protein